MKHATMVEGCTLLFLRFLARASLEEPPTISESKLTFDEKKNVKA